MNVAENILKYKSLLPHYVELVAVSKFHPASLIMEAYEAGQRTFGESRVQEFLEKKEILPSDIKWHFIGHLQTNKVKQIIGKVNLIESVDTIKLLYLIDEESSKHNLTTDILLQVHIAAEETKFGFYPNELIDFLNEGSILNLKATNIRGVMGMATNTQDENRVREDFKKIHSLYSYIKDNYNIKGFDRLSMGMSGDWQIAVEEGANIVRIGSSIFGQRY